MDELMKLLESAMIPQEAREVLESEFTALADQIKEAEQVKADEKVSEAVKELQALIPEMIEEAVSEEIADLADEVQESRQLEVTYATKLEEFKEAYTKKHDERLETLVAEGIAEEIEELKEDIEVAKKAKFALSLVEAFGNSYAENFGADDIDSREELQSVREQLESYQRKEKLDDILESLQGNKRKVAETVLSDVPVDKLEERFEQIKGFILNESQEAPEGSEQLDESADDNDKQDKEPKGTVVLENVEDDEEAVEEAVKPVHSAISKSLQLAKGNYVTRRR